MNDFDIAKFRFLDKDTKEVLREEEMSFYDAKMTVINNDCIMELVE